MNKKFLRDHNILEKEFYHCCHILSKNKQTNKNPLVKKHYCKKKKNRFVYFQEKVLIFPS